MREFDDPSRAPRWRLAARLAPAIALASFATIATAATPSRTAGAGATAARSPGATPGATQLAASSRAPGALGPGASAPASSSTAGTAWLGLSVGALSAFDVGQSLSMQVDYGVVRTPASWRRFDLEWHLVLGFSAPSGKTDLTTTVVPPGGYGAVAVSSGTEKVSALLFEIVPTARLHYNVSRGFSVFADGGLGLCQSLESYDRTEMYVGHSTWKESATGLELRTALGMAVDVTPRWRLLLVPVGFTLQLGPKFSGFTPSFGLAYRL